MKSDNQVAAAGWSPPRGLPKTSAIRISSIVDGSYYLPSQKRDARAEYLAGHIPGAVFFDIDEIADHSNPLPHMLPDAESFAQTHGPSRHRRRHEDRGL